MNSKRYLLPENLALNPNRISIALSSSKHFIKIPKSSKHQSKIGSDQNSKKSNGNDSRI